LAALPGIVSELLVNGKLVKPGNFSAIVNFLGSRIRKVGLDAPVRNVGFLFHSARAIPLDEVGERGLVDDVGDGLADLIP
jgi:hypothetical protein